MGVERGEAFKMWEEEEVTFTFDMRMYMCVFERE
jgi:hypothetical protein